METCAPRVLLIDDDAPLCQLLVEYLGAEGLRLTTAHDGETGLREIHGGAFELVILDIMLPDISGLEVLRRIRRTSDLAVLMLTARGDDLDRILGLELGADDYLAKPCNPRELAARAHAVLRRTRHVVPDTRPEQAPASWLTLSITQRRANWRDTPLNLTSTEFNILAALFENAGTVVSKAELSQRALGRTLVPYDRSLDMHLSHLRRKLGTFADGRSPIQTIHGAGYILLKD
ncbi:MAG: response regulator transcription factor [Rhodocyclaceae bacterium]|nr:response regulator transcription factor [Rhodocyclaceae bacterium]